MADFSTALENPSAKGVLIDIEDNAQNNSKADTTTNFESMDRLVDQKIEAILKSLNGLIRVKDIEQDEFVKSSSE